MVFEMDYNRGDVICVGCGLVAPGSNLCDIFALPAVAASNPEKPHRVHQKPRVTREVRLVLNARGSGLSAKYKHVTYWREIWRLFRGQEPEIPQPDIALIACIGRKRYPEAASKDQLREILNQIDRVKRAAGERGYFVQKYLVRYIVVCVCRGRCSGGTYCDQR